MGLFTFLPGRMMSRVLFSQTPTIGVWLRCVCFWRGILVLAAPDTAFRAVLEKRIKGGLAAAPSAAPSATIAA